MTGNVNTDEAYRAFLENVLIVTTTPAVCSLWSFVVNCIAFFPLNQGVLENIDDIVVCSGTGGTATGLGVANYLTGSKLK